MNGWAEVCPFMCRDLVKHKSSKSSRPFNTPTATLTITVCSTGSVKTITSALHTLHHLKVNLFIAPGFRMWCNTSTRLLLKFFNMLQQKKIFKLKTCPSLWLWVSYCGFMDTCCLHLLPLFTFSFPLCQCLHANIRRSLFLFYLPNHLADKEITGSIWFEENHSLPHLHTQQRRLTCSPSSSLPHSDYIAYRSGPVRLPGLH